MSTPELLNDQGPTEDTTSVVNGESAEGTVDNSIPTQATEPQQEQTTQAPWAQYLEKFPSSLHPVAEEVFKEWDGNVTKRFQDLHSTYEPYKPFVEAWEPDAINEALQLAQALEADPRAFMDALANAYGFAESEQGVENQQQQDQQDPEDVVDNFELDPNDPLQQRLSQQEELLRALSDHILGQKEAEQQAKEQAEQDAALDTAMQSLKAQHGEFDEQYVLMQIANGVDPDQAVQQFQSLVGQWAAKQNAPAASAPRVMGASGGLPSNRVDPATLNSKQTKDLVVELLRSQNGG